MLFRIAYCEQCDDIKFPEELVKQKGECSICKKDTCKIALFDTDDGVKSLLEAKK